MEGPPFSMLNWDENEGAALGEQAKAADEIEELIVAEDMPDLDRAELLLREGQVVQMLSVVGNLHSLVRVSEDALERLVPLVTEVLTREGADGDLQLEAMESLRKACEAGTLPAPPQPGSAMSTQRESLTAPVVGSGGAAAAAALAVAAATAVATAEAGPWAPAASPLASPLLLAVDSHANPTDPNDGCRPGPLLSAERCVGQCLPLIKAVIAASKDVEVVNEAMDALFAMLGRVPVDQLRAQVVDWAVACADVSQPTLSRVAASLAFGEVALLQLLPADVLPAALSLCQDTESEVRGGMARQINALARCVGADTAAQQVLPELLELVQDEEPEVRTAAIVALMELLDFVPTDAVRERMVPVLLELAQSPPAAQVTTVAEVFGPAIFKLSRGRLSHEELQPLVDLYAAQAEHADAEVRRLCAFNFPGVLKSCHGQGFPDQLRGVLDTLLGDAFPPVRVALAAGLHHAAALVGKALAAEHLKEPYVRLLTDESTDVQAAAVARLPDMLTALAEPEEEARQAVMADVLRGIVQVIEGLAAHRWRQQLLLVRHAYVFPLFFSPEQVYEHVVPMLFRFMADASKPVREASARALCYLMRKSCTGTQRAATVERLHTDFRRGRHFHHRMLFVDVCRFLIEFNSRAAFRDAYFEAALAGLQDEVANVRIRACQLLPAVKGTLSFPADAAALETVSTWVATLLGDPDRDVVDAAREASAAIVRQDAERAKRADGGLDEEAEAEDQRKAAEEAEILVADGLEAEAIKKRAAEMRRQELFARNAAGRGGPGDAGDPRRRTRSWGTTIDSSTSRAAARAGGTQSLKLHDGADPITAAAAAAATHAAMQSDLADISPSGKRRVVAGSTTVYKIDGAGGAGGAGKGGGGGGGGGAGKPGTKPKLPAMPQAGGKAKPARRASDRSRMPSHTSPAMQHRASAAAKLGGPQGGRAGHKLHKPSAPKRR